MNHWYTQLQLLAVRNSWDAFGSGFRGKRGRFGVSDWLTLAGVVAGVVIVIWVLARVVQNSNRKTYRSPRKLFRELCLAHELNWKDRRFLIQLAKAHQLSLSAMIFLDPVRFQPAHINQADPQTAARLNHLRKKLFGNVAP